MTDVPAELAMIGSVVRPHGIRGELIVEATGQVIADVRQGTSVWVGDARVAYVVERIRPHRRRWLVRLLGVDDRDAAEALRQAAIRVRAKDLPATVSDEFYVHDLLGCTVVRGDGSRLGEITRVIPSRPHDLMEVTDGRRTVLVPMVRDWLVELDMTGRRITVDLPAGLEEHTSLGG